MTIDERIALLKAIKKNPDAKLEFRAALNGFGGLDTQWHPVNVNKPDGNFNFATYDYRIKKVPRVRYIILNLHGAAVATMTDKDRAERTFKTFSENYPSGGPYELVEFVEKIVDAAA